MIRTAEQSTAGTVLIRRHISGIGAIRFRPAVSHPRRITRAASTVGINPPLNDPAINLLITSGGDHAAGRSVSKPGGVIVFRRPTGGEHHTRQFRIAVVLELILLAVRQFYRTNYWNPASSGCAIEFRKKLRIVLKWTVAAECVR